MTGAQAVARALLDEGVTTVFGYPGAAICPFYEAMRETSLRHILVRHEENAGHAASGYARVSGKAGVCIATSGPGATNLITALATAYMDSIPIVAITGQVSTEVLGRDVFQEADITGSAAPFIKYSFLIKNADEIPRIIKEAFYLATTGRQGPVLVDIPVDIQDTEIEYKAPELPNIRGYKPSSKGNALQLRRVLAAMHEAKRPLICAGGGVFGAHAEKEVQKLCEQCAVPAVSTLMGLGVLPTAHEMYVGMLGMYGSKNANEALNSADLLIIIGARVGDRAMKSPALLSRKKRVIHIDIDPAEIGKNMETNIPLVGDAGLIIKQILEQCGQLETSQWLDDIKKARAAEKQLPLSAKNGFVNPYAFLTKLSNSMYDDGIYISDVGQNQIWSARSVNLRSGRFLTSGGMGTMGYSLPAAIGAKLAEPKKQVVAVCGDGAFQMQLPELATMVQHGVAVKLVVLNNTRLGMVHELQKSEYGACTAVELGGIPDICAVAKAYGVDSLCIADNESIDEAVKKFLREDKPFVLECKIDPDESTKR
ncbi:MAG: biosynthetic-type acetolactate synthase large subunit [Hydrogenoanaerobacterium sp.]